MCVSGRKNPPPHLPTRSLIVGIAAWRLLPPTLRLSRQSVPSGAVGAVAVPGTRVPNSCGRLCVHHDVEACRRDRNGNGRWGFDGTGEGLFGSAVCRCGISNDACKHVHRHLHAVVLNADLRGISCVVVGPSTACSRRPIGMNVIVGSAVSPNQHGLLWWQLLLFPCNDLGTVVFNSHLFLGFAVVPRVLDGWLGGVPHIPRRLHIKWKRWTGLFSVRFCLDQEEMVCKHFFVKVVKVEGSIKRRGRGVFSFFLCGLQIQERWTLVEKNPHHRRFFV